MTIGENIRKYRKAKGYTQRELANLLNVKISAVSAWEIGRNQPLMDNVEKLAHVLGVQKSDLIENDNSTKQKIDLSKDNDNVIFTYEGRQIPPEDIELMKRLLRGKKE